MHYRKENNKEDSHDLSFKTIKITSIL